MPTAVATLSSVVVDSPVGPLTLVASDDALVAVLWPAEDPRRVRLSSTPRVLAAAADHPVLATAETQLTEWFAARRTTFDLPLAVTGTDFQQRAWTFLSAIPHGTTRSYRDEAQALGLAQGFQAVGNANRCNPLSIVVPCHRVIGSDGALTGFAAGLSRKEKLLQLEGALP